MEYSETNDETTKLARMRRRFEESVDHHRSAHAEAHRAARFYHNTEMEGQWEPDDLQYLQDEGRPAFTFNVLKPKTDTWLGMYADSQRTPTICGSGGDDKMHAEVVDIVSKQVLQDAKFERKSARWINTGVVQGECSMHVEVVPSNKGRGWIEINLYRILPFELHWDCTSVEPDRSDARHVFWDRWLDEDEFREAYPKYADEFGSLSKRGSEESNVLDTRDYGEEDSTGDYDTADDYDGGRASRYYFDRHKRKARVIRYEYKTTVTKFYGIDDRTGERVGEVSAERKKLIEQARETLGAPFSVEESKEEVVKVCEFIGPRILAEYDSAGPFDGFSIITFCYAVDEETGTAYGFLRNLMDPQMELNKAKSLSIEHMAQRVGGGWISEEGQLTDEQQFANEMRRAGGVGITKQNAIAEGRVQRVEPSAADPGAQARAAEANELLTEISGIPSSASFSPAEQAQAGMTVAIRYNKSRQTVQGPFGNFEDATSGVVRRVAEAISRAMPDDQITSILGREDRFQVGNGFVVEMTPDPKSGQMVPKARAALRDMRSMNWNIELEHTSSNSTLRMIELDTLLQLQNAGVMIDPEVSIERAVESKSVQERLKQYHEKMQRAQGQGQEAEAQSFREQMMQTVQVELKKLAETQRHNVAEESIKAEKAEKDFIVDLAKVWESADESEKDFILQIQARAQQNQPTA